MVTEVTEFTKKVGQLNGSAELGHSCSWKNFRTLFARELLLALLVWRHHEALSLRSRDTSTPPLRGPSNFDEPPDVFFVSGRRSCLWRRAAMKSDRRSQTTPNALLTQISGRREHLLVPVILMGQIFSTRFL